MTLSLEQRLARVTGLAELTSDPHVSEVQLLGDGRVFVRRREARVAAPSVVPAEELVGLLRALEARAALASPDAGAAGAVGVEVGAFQWVRLSEPLARGVALFGVRLYEPRASWEALCRASRLPLAQRAAVEQLVAQGHGVVLVGPAEARPERVLSGLLDLRPDAGHVVVVEGSRAVPLDGVEATSLRRPAMQPHERALCLPIAQRGDVLLGAQLRHAEDWAWCMGLGAQQRLLSLDAASPQEALAALLGGILAQAPDTAPVRLRERLGLRALLVCEPDGEGGPRLVEALALPSQPLSSASEGLALAPLAPREPARFADKEHAETTSPAVRAPESAARVAQAPTVALAPVAVAAPVVAPVVAPVAVAAPAPVAPVVLASAPVVAPVVAPVTVAAPASVVPVASAPVVAPVAVLAAPVAPTSVAASGVTAPMSLAAPEAAPKSEPKPTQRASVEVERLTASVGAPATVRVAAVSAEGQAAPPAGPSSSSQTPSRPPVGVPLGPPSGPPPVVGAGRPFGGGEEAPKAPPAGRLPVLPPTERLPQLLSPQDPPTLGEEDPASISLQVVTRKTIETPRLDLLMDAAELDEAQTRERPLVERPLVERPAPVEPADEPVDPALRLRRRLGRAPEPQSWGRSASEPAIPAASPTVAPAEPVAPAGPPSRGLTAHRTGEAPSLGRPLGGGTPATLRSPTPTPSDKAPSPPGGVARLGGGGSPALRAVGGSGGFGAVSAAPPSSASRSAPEPAPARPVVGGAPTATPARRASRFGAIERQASFKPAEPVTPNVGSTLRSFQRNAADEGVEVQLGGAASGQEGSLDPSFPSDDGRTLQHSASDLGLDEDTTSQRSAGAFGPYAAPARSVSSQDATTEVRMEGKDARRFLRELDEDEP